MLNKSRFAIAAALMLGAASVAQAANENMDREGGGFACGPLHQRMGGRGLIQFITVQYVTVVEFMRTLGHTAYTGAGGFTDEQAVLPAA
jgi:TnpA family transposase